MAARPRRRAGSSEIKRWGTVQRQPSQPVLQGGIPQEWSWSCRLEFSLGFMARGVARGAATTSPECSGILDPLW